MRLSARAQFVWTISMYYIDMYGIFLFVLTHIRKKNDVMKIESSIHFLPLTYQIFNRCRRKQKYRESGWKKNFFFRILFAVRVLPTGRSVEIKWIWDISKMYTFCLLFVVIIKSIALHIIRSIICTFYCLLSVGKVSASFSGSTQPFMGFRFAYF